MSSVLIMGAGSVGCYLGGVLAAAGVDVHFVGRPRVLADLRQHGLTVSDRDGRHQRIPPDRLNLHEFPPTSLAPCSTLLCVKTGATVEAAQSLNGALLPGSVVISMQNGIGNAERAQAAAPVLECRAGMVPFNVAALSPGHFHRGTGGALVAQSLAGDDPPLLDLQAAFARQNQKLTLVTDAAAMRAVQWGKLLINLNNPVNALSGRPLRAELLQRGYRRCFAALQAEALALLNAAQISAAPMSPLSPDKLIALLRLPNMMFRVLAAQMLKIDAKARSSMADDLALGRITEIDALSGEVVRLAQSLGCQAPLNARILALVQAWPQNPQPYGPRELEIALGL
jgi:2-dehydropantoate 2-reductase